MSYKKGDLVTIKHWPIKVRLAVEKQSPVSGSLRLELTENMPPYNKGDKIIFMPYEVDRVPQL